MSNEENFEKTFESNEEKLYNPHPYWWLMETMVATASNLTEAEPLVDNIFNVYVDTPEGRPRAQRPPTPYHNWIYNDMRKAESACKKLEKSNEIAMQKAARQEEAEKKRC